MNGMRVDGTLVRWIGGIGLVVAAVIHVQEALGFGGVLSALFVLSALGTVAGAVLLAWAPRWGWIVGGGVAGLTALGYVLRSTVGLPPLFPQPIPFSQPTAGAVCTIVEIAVAVLAALVLVSSRAKVANRT